MKLIREFKEFAVKGNVVDMSVGIIIGAAFTTIVNSLVKDIAAPIFSVLVTGVNSKNWFIVLKDGVKGGPYVTMTDAINDNAVFLNVGSFVNAVVSFLIVSIALFFVVKSVNRLRRPRNVTANPVETKECEQCYQIISSKAKRCPFCTSEQN